MAATRVIFVNRFFWPDFSATSQILSDVSFALAAEGTTVEIIASRLAYGDNGTRFPAFEEHGGVRIHRVATTGFGRAGIAGRAIDYLSFYLSALAKAIALLRRGDALIVKTDPPLLSIPMRLAARLRGARQVNWLQDIYPEIAGLLGMTAFGGRMGRVLAWLRNHSLRSSDRNVVIGTAMRDKLRVMGLGEDQVEVIENFADDEAITPLEPASNALRNEWGYPTDTLVVGYSGNLGRAHDLPTMLDAARLLQQRDVANVRFLFIGGGALFDDIGRYVDAHALTNIDCRPYQPRSRLSESLTVPDIHWISLRPEVEGYLLPSKFYGVLAAGRATVFIGAQDGELAALVRDHGCGWTFGVGDSGALADTLAALAMDRVSVSAAGRAARQLMDERFRRTQIFGKWSRLLHDLS